MKVLSVEQMRRVDSITVDNYASEKTLMYEAGQGVFREVMAFSHRYDFNKFLIVCGKGNNAGDGYVVAKLIADIGYDVRIVSVCEQDKLHGTTLFYSRQKPEVVNLTVGFELPELDSNTLIVDALLGTGFKGELRPEYISLINAINYNKNPVISVDIPSGLNGDTGVAQPVAVYADVTVTIGAPKRGLFYNDGLEHCGNLSLVQISIPQSLIDQQVSDSDAIFEQDISFLHRRRKRDSHKKSFGSVAVIGGSNKYHGAPQLAAHAALRAGCGYVTLAIPEVVDSSKMPLSVIRKNLPVVNGVLSGSAIPFIEEMIYSSGTTTVFGPGCGRSQETVEVLDFAINNSNSLLIDADGLYLLTKIDNFRFFTIPTVLTPHPGEMKTLIDHFLPELKNEDRVTQALALAELINAYVVLKGKTSIIVSPNYQCWINTSGNEALATAGTGDVLSGIIGAFMTEALISGEPIEEALKAAVFVHGRAGEYALCRRSFSADDIPEMLAKVFTDINRLI